jgi:GNAT superfamily N-acetyltransferase
MDDAELGRLEHENYAATGWRLCSSVEGDVAVYAGYADGEPVSSGLGIRIGRTIGVYNIATVERARRRGYGAAMTSRVVADGAAAGCDVAILQASPMGLPVYERLGFRTVLEYNGWVEPSSLPTGVEAG